MSCRMILPAGGGSGVTILCFYGPSFSFPGGILSGDGVGNYLALANEAGYQYPIPRAGTLRRLWVHADASGGTGTGTYVVRVNGVDTTITCTMGANPRSDLVHTASVVAGDLVSLKQSCSSSPFDVCASLEFVG